MFMIDQRYFYNMECRENFFLSFFFQQTAMHEGNKCCFFGEKKINLLLKFNQTTKNVILLQTLLHTYKKDIIFTLNECIGFFKNTVLAKLGRILFFFLIYLHFGHVRHAKLPERNINI